MKYEQFKVTYNSKVENDNLWKILLNELDENNADPCVNLENICLKMGIKVENSLINEKGNITQINSELIIKTDKTNSKKVNRFTIAHEIGHAILHYNLLKEGITFESNYVANEINHSRFEIEANQFAAALLVEDNHFTNEINKLIDENIANNITTYVKDVKTKMSDLYDVSESVIENKLKAQGFIKW